MGLASKHITPTIIKPSLSDVVDSISEQGLEVGQVVRLDNGGEAVLVQAGSEIAQYNAVLIGENNAATNLVSASIAQGTGSGQIGWAQVSIASSKFGWVQTRGKMVGKVAANCQDHVLLFSSDTGGVVDDVTVSVGFLPGVQALTSVTTASAVTILAGDYVFASVHVNPA